MITTVKDEKTLEYNFSEEELENRNFSKALKKIQKIAKTEIEDNILTVEVKDNPGVLIDEIREILMGDVHFEYEEIEVEPEEQDKDGKIINEAVIELKQIKKDLTDCPCFSFTKEKEDERIISEIDDDAV